MKNEITKKNDGGLINQNNTTNDIAGKKEIEQQILNRKVGFLERLLPGQETKKVIEFKTKALEQEAKSDLELRRMHNEFFRQGLAETYNKILTEGKRKVREEIALSGAVEMKNLQEKIQNITEEFLENMEQVEEKIYETKSDNIRNRKLRMYNNRLEEFENVISILMKKYEDISKEGV